MKNQSKPLQTIFKISCKYTQGMLSNWNICFNIFNKRTDDKNLRNLNKTNDTFMQTTCTNFQNWCQQTTKTTSKCNTDSVGLVCQLWSVILKCMRDSKPQPCVQQHKLLKVTWNATNRDKHINEALKQTFANNIF